MNDSLEYDRRRFLELAAGTAAVAAGQLLGLRPAVARDAHAAAHAPWSRILAATVSPAGWVDYAKVRSRYAPDLRAYLRRLAGAAVNGASRNDAKAWWINAYNAICVQTLLDHGLPAEVPHAKLFGKNIFTERRYAVAGKIRSLDDIEHGILRKQYRDARVHAALVCGASSCPRLRTEAYVGARLDTQLDEECRSWIMRETTKTGTRKNRLDRQRETMFASKIFDWYDEDFGNSKRGILRFIARYSDAEQRQFLATHDVDLEFLPYDWALNKQG